MFTSWILCRVKEHFIFSRTPGRMYITCSLWSRCYTEYFIRFVIISMGNQHNTQRLRERVTAVTQERAVEGRLLCFPCSIFPTREKESFYIRYVNRDHCTNIHHGRTWNNSCSWIYRNAMSCNLSVGLFIDSFEAFRLNVSAHCQDCAQLLMVQ